MAHNIMTYTGRQAAWHALGVVAGKHQTWAECCAATPALNFQVYKARLQDHKGRAIDAWGMFRDSDEGVFLGTVGEDYTPIQHQSGFELIDALMGTSDGAHYETAGSLGLGERVWGLADLGLVAKIGADEQKGYLLFATGHDGSMSFQLRTCMTRVVCQNTLNVAMGERTRSKFMIRHTRNAQNRIQSAQDALQSVRGEVATVESKLNFLASRKITRDSLETIMGRLFPKNEGAKFQTRRENVLAEVLSLYESNDRDTFPEFRGSAYNLLNAVTEWTDHISSPSKTGQSRAESALFNGGDTRKSQAFHIIMEESANLPSNRAFSLESIAIPAPVAGQSILDAIVAAS